MATSQTQSFGPWTARSNLLPQSAGSSERIRTEAAEALHEKEVMPPEPAPDKMALTRSKTSPPGGFMLGSSKSSSGHEPRHDPQAQRDRITMFKRQLAANRTRGTEEVLKRNKANNLHRPGVGEQALKDSHVSRNLAEAMRGEEGKRHAGGRGDTALQIATEDWPFVYFVVALDQMPVASEEMGEFKVGKPHTARERQRFLAARKRRIQQSREEMERIRESNIDMGLRLEPIRPVTRTPGFHAPQHSRSRLNTAPDSSGNIHSRHPPTPNSSGSSRDFPMHRSEYYLNNGDQLSMEEMMCRGFSQWFSDNFSTGSNSQPGSRPGGEIGAVGVSTTGKVGKPDPKSLTQNGDPDSNTGLPDILNEQLKKKGITTTTTNNTSNNNGNKSNNRNSQPNSAPSSLHAVQTNNNNKKVHFAEGLPFIKGSSIPVAQAKQDPPEPPVRPPTTPQVPKVEDVDASEDMLKPPWSAPVTARPLPTMTPKSKNFKPLPIPKIDIVSEIYDELIVKTIQSFLAREGYSEGKFTNLRQKIMARLSATYPHLAGHRAWRVVHKDGGPGGECQSSTPMEPEEKNRLRLRPLHQGFFATEPPLCIGNFSREESLSVKRTYRRQLGIPLNF